MARVVPTKPEIGIHHEANQVRYSCVPSWIPLRSSLRTRRSPVQNQTGRMRAIPPDHYILVQSNSSVHTARTNPGTHHLTEWPGWFPLNPKWGLTTRPTKYAVHVFPSWIPLPSDPHTQEKPTQKTKRLELSAHHRFQPTTAPP